MLVVAMCQSMEKGRVDGGSSSDRSSPVDNGGGGSVLIPQGLFALKHPRFLNLRFPAATISTRLFSTLSSTLAPAVANTAAADEFGVELGRLLALLPDELRAKITKHPEFRELIEVVLDLGRKPLARFPSGDFALSDSAVTAQDLEFATSQVGDFAVDNRAGISRTLHRISAIGNQKGRIIGLTCRVGRATPGSANALKDLVQGVEPEIKEPC